MHKNKILIIGSGISGLSAANLLKDRSFITVLEKSNLTGGLIRCEKIDGHLYHKVGGHIFNSKIPKVLDWFWSYFNKDNEFLKTTRNAKILWQNKIIGYPVEDYVYQMGEQEVKDIIRDWVNLSSTEKRDPFSYKNFESFLKGQFGETLYQLYFKPYNQKIWQTDLSNIPMEWLEGKLPMPELISMFQHNFLHQEESEMVHSTFFYPREGGSQFIINRLSEGINIQLNSEVSSMVFDKDHWIVNGEPFNNIIYTGDVRKIPGNLNITLPRSLISSLEKLQSNGTSNMLCETDPTDISWLYIPSPQLRAHRIIYTGNFSQNNNKAGGRISCTVEFSGKTSEAEMLEEINKLPGNLKPIAWNYEPNSYVIQSKDTRKTISDLKAILKPYRFHLLGRFAEWEYYNMDKCIEAAMKLADQLKFLNQ